MEAARTTPKTDGHDDARSAEGNTRFILDADMSDLIEFEPITAEKNQELAEKAHSKAPKGGVSLAQANDGSTKNRDPRRNRPVSESSSPWPRASETTTRQELEMLKARLKKTEYYYAARLKRSQDNVGYLESIVGDYENLEKEYESLQTRAQDQAREIDSLTEQMRTFQVNAFEKLHSARSMPDSTPNIRRQLNAVSTNIKQWSRRHAVSDREKASQMLPILAERGCIQSVERFQEALSRRESPPPLWLLVSAVISADIFHHILGNCFFIFDHPDSTDEDSVLSPSGADSLRKLVVLIEDNVKTAEAASWRCDLFRLLDPSKGSGQTLKTMITKAKDSACQNLAERCLESIDSFVTSGEEAKSKLLSIFTDCADLAWKLWSQKTSMRVLDFEQTMSLHGRREFHHRSPYVEPHGLHNAILEENSDALDGQEVVLLVNPLVQASGTVVDEWERTVVWKKGLVWMC